MATPQEISVNVRANTSINTNQNNTTSLGKVVDFKKLAQQLPAKGIKFSSLGVVAQRALAVFNTDSDKEYLSKAELNNAISFFSSHDVDYNEMGLNVKKGTGVDQIESHKAIDNLAKKVAKNMPKELIQALKNNPYLNKSELIKMYLANADISKYVKADPFEAFFEGEKFGAMEDVNILETIAKDLDKHIFNMRFPLGNGKKAEVTMINSYKLPSGRMVEAFADREGKQYFQYRAADRTVISEKYFKQQEGLTGYDYSVDDRGMLKYNKSK